MKSVRKSVSFSFFLIFLLLFSSSVSAAFQAAVITLVFPPGARATGLGEAFVALADDANATFFNPAGLGQAPLANTWKAHLANSGSSFYVIAAKKKKEFSLSEKIWAGTQNGLLRYSGKSWESHEIYLIEEGDDLLTIARKYLETEDEEAIEKAALIIRKTNDIEMKRYKSLTTLFEKQVADSSADKQSGDSTLAPADLALEILELDPVYHDSSGIFNALAEKIDTTTAAALTNEVTQILTTEDKEFKNLVELKVPFTIAVDDSITALAVDASEKVWIGTPSGLWRFDGSTWSRFGILDGLPSTHITSLGVGPYDEIAVGTDLGLAVFSEGLWETYELDFQEIPEPQVDAVAFGTPGVLYVGTPYGLLVKKEDSWEMLDTSDGLLNQSVTALMFDSQDQLWIGGKGGISIYDETSWKRYKFPESKVYSFGELEEGRVWIGTNRGAISYKEGRVRTDKEGAVVQEPPEWKAFHSKNALKGDDVYGVAVHGKDVWLATDKAVNQYDYAEKQVMLFWELLLPALKLRDLHHMYASFVLPTEDWGTLGFTINFINFGENYMTDEEGREIARFRSWEGVFGLNYGLALKEDLSLGLNIKYVHSALAPGIGEGSEGVGRTFAVDAGLLKRNLLTRGLDLGLSLQNMGPPIFYISREEADPIPFTIKFGLAYRAVETPLHDLNLLLDLNRELAKNYIERDPDPFWKAIVTDLEDEEGIVDIFEEVNVNMGLEYWYLQFIAARMGFLFDYLGERYELTIGLGVKYGNLNFDFSYIHSPPGFFKDVMKTFIKDETDSHLEGSHGVRHGQPRFSLIFKF
ncbi:MAG: PorV/PorQ family protein [Chitinivibrionales bacterium]|nr:PorV/PorQ family protein [Chitinivibrionales bacterium]